MDPKRSFSFQASLFMLMFGLAFSVTSIPDSAFEIQGYIASRHLLQAKKSCPINFEAANYTIITSKCKGPKYPADVCCPALKEFACSYDEINDATLDCSTTMFSYINLYGKYPAGLFANECKEGKDGLACDEESSGTSANHSACHITQNSSLGILVSGSIIGFLLSWY